MIRTVETFAETTNSEKTPPYFALSDEVPGDFSEFCGAEITRDIESALPYIEVLHFMPIYM